MDTPVVILNGQQLDAIVEVQEDLLRRVHVVHIHCPDLLAASRLLRK